LGIPRLPQLRHSGLHRVQGWPSLADDASVYLGITQGHLQNGRVEGQVMAESFWLLGWHAAPSPQGQSRVGMKFQCGLVDPQ